MAGVLTFFGILIILGMFKSLISDPLEWLYWLCFLGCVGAMVWVLSLFV